jgi:hypothetical protein
MKAYTLSFVIFLVTPSFLFAQNNALRLKRSVRNSAGRYYCGGEGCRRCDGGGSAETDVEFIGESLGTWFDNKIHLSVLRL